MTSKKEIGKKSRQAGQRFELSVRKNLEKKGWNVDKFTNNVDLNNSGSLNPVKPKFLFDPKLKRSVMVGNSGGFPDFICFKQKLDGLYNVVGVESKMNGTLDKTEKEKCNWLLKNKIFGEIQIASKGQKRGEIKYKKYQIKK